MDEVQKKKILIIVAVAGLILAAAMSYYHLREGSRDVLANIPQSEKVLLLCQNNQCQVEFQIPARDFYQYVMDNFSPGTTASAYHYPCNECAGRALEAIQCAECGAIFLKTAARQGDFADRCPDCGYSEEAAARGQ